MAVETGARGRVLLLSDGNETGGDALAAIARARQAGVAVDVVPLSFALQDEVLVEKVAAPAEVREGEPFVVRVVIRAGKPTPATVRLLRDGALVEARRVDLAAGSSVEEFALPPGLAGLARLEAVVTPIEEGKAEAGHDTWPQNDVAHAFTLVPGSAHVLHVSDAPIEVTTPLRNALAAAGLRVDAVTPADLPTGSTGLWDVDLVVLDDVPRDAISSAQLDALVDAVTDLGVGLVLVGGPESFGAGGWTGSRLEEVCPVEMEPKGQVVLPSVALGLVIDRSGSMSGEKLELAKRAAVVAAQALSSKDEIGVVTFDTSAAWAVPMRSAADDAAIRALVAAIDEGGGTFMDPGLRMAHAGLKTSKASIKHCIALTDGRTDGGDPARLALLMAQDRITVSSVAVGGDADVEMLRRVARAGGGKLYTVNDAKDLPRIFVKEAQRIARSLIRNETVKPERRGEGVVLVGLDGFPEVDGWVLCEAKPRAEVPLVLPDGSPLLAHWQIGLGRVAAFTSDARPRWATRWTAWKGFTAFWAQLLRWARRDVEGSSRLEAKVSRRGDKAIVAVDAIDAQGEPREGLALVARVRAPNTPGPGLEVPLVSRGGGRYEVELDASVAGVHDVRLLEHGPKGLVPAATTAVVVPYAAEFARLSSDDARLAELARAAGGRVLSPKDLVDAKVDPFDPTDLPDRQGRREGWPLLLAAALFLFLLDVAWRRVSIDLRALIGKVVPVAAPTVTSDRAMGALLARKEAVREAERESKPRVAPTPVVSPPSERVPTVTVAGAPTDGAPAPPAAPLGPVAPKAPAQGDQPPVEGGLGARLLAAKRRALKPHEGGGDPGGGAPPSA
jgi:Ca-activated chloride channel family protein